MELRLWQAIGIDPRKLGASYRELGQGMGPLTAQEIKLFKDHNRQYRRRFGFPFVICARLNKKKAILAGFRALASARIEPPSPHATGWRCGRGAGLASVGEGRRRRGMGGDKGV